MVSLNLMDSKRQNPSTPVSEEYLRQHTVGELRPLAGPIRLVEYDSEWPHKYEHEMERIRTTLGQRVLRIEHVGSTSGLVAKPVIDIVLEVEDETQYVPALQTACYLLHLRETDWYPFENRFGRKPTEIDYSARWKDAGKQIWSRVGLGQGCCSNKDSPHVRGNELLFWPLRWRSPSTRSRIPVK